MCQWARTISHKKSESRVSTFRGFHRTMDFEDLGLCFHFGWQCSLHAEFHGLDNTSIMKSVVVRSGGLVHHFHKLHFKWITPLLLTVSKMKIIPQILYHMELLLNNKWVQVLFDPDIAGSGWEVPDKTYWPHSSMKSLHGFVNLLQWSECFQFLSTSTHYKGYSAFHSLFH